MMVWQRFVEFTMAQWGLHVAALLAHTLTDHKWIRRTAGMIFVRSGLWVIAVNR
jgi:hydrogenase/urease accessory protein HupE